MTDGTPSEFIKKILAAVRAQQREDTAVAEISETVRRLCEENSVQAKGSPRISSNASYKDCLAYAGYHYTTFVVRQALKKNAPPGNVTSRFGRMCKALKAGAPELDKSLLIDIGCGPGLFLHAAYAKADSEQTVLYGYDHSKEMLKLAKDIWKRRELVLEPRFSQQYEEITEAAKNDLQRQPKHLIFTFGYVWVQIARNGGQKALDDFVQQTAASIALLSEHAQTCTIIAIDSGLQPGNLEAFTGALGRIRQESRLEWDKKPFNEGRRGKKLSAIWTVRESNE